MASSPPGCVLAWRRRHIYGPIRLPWRGGYCRTTKSMDNSAYNSTVLYIVHTLVHAAVNLLQLQHMHVRTRVVIACIK